MDDSIKPFGDLTHEERRAAGPAEDAVRCFRLISYTGQRLRYLLDRSGTLAYAVISQLAREVARG